MAKLRFTISMPLGGGMRLFGETADTVTLALVDTRTLGNGAVILTYHPVRA